MTAPARPGALAKCALTAAASARRRHAPMSRGAGQDSPEPAGRHRESPRHAMHAPSLPKLRFSSGEPASRRFSSPSSGAPARRLSARAQAVAAGEGSPGPGPVRGGDDSDESTAQPCPCRRPGAARRPHSNVLATSESSGLSCPAYQLGQSAGHFGVPATAEWVPDDSGDCERRCRQVRGRSQGSGRG